MVHRLQEDSRVKKGLKFEGKSKEELFYPKKGLKFATQQESEKVEKEKKLDKVKKVSYNDSENFTT